MVLYGRIKHHIIEVEITVNKITLPAIMVERVSCIYGIILQYPCLART
jgi:hypothetical protein